MDFNYDSRDCIRNNSGRLANRGKHAMRIFSTFSGIGGFEIGIDNAWMETEPEKSYPIVVGYSEIDKHAISVYEKHFQGVQNYGDITKIDAESLPDFDCLVGGFPCQAFSIAGKRKGFDDTRGTLFFDLARILRAKRPRLFVFENVKGLLNHDGGRTFRVIVSTIDELGYDCQWQVLNSKDFGVPQNRERIVIVGHLRGTPRPKVFPIIGENGQALAPSQPASGGSQKFIKTRHLSQNGRLISESTTLQASEIPHIVDITPKIITGTPTYGNGQRTVKYAISDTVPTIRATHYKNGDNQPRVLIREATKKGYAEAEIGDSINLSQPNSKTRRGRVGKGIANTLDTGMHQYTMISRTVRAGGRGSPHGSKQNWDSYEVDGVIRRLTPVECERLQAFPDDWTKFAAGGGRNIRYAALQDVR